MRDKSFYILKIKNAAFSSKYLCNYQNNIVISFSLLVIVLGLIFVLALLILQ